MSAVKDWKTFHAINLRKLGSLGRTDASCNSMSIFAPTATRDRKIYDMITNFKASPYASDTLLDRAIGCIMAHAIGDSMGSVLEFQEVDYTRKLIVDFDQTYFCYRRKKLPEIFNAFQLKVGQYTDDFSMGLCLADSLLACGKMDCVDLRRRFLRWWFSGYNNAFRFDSDRKGKMSVGLGGNIAESFSETIEDEEIRPQTRAGSPATSGNGSVMRLSPVALYFHHDLAQALDAAEAQSLTTHQGTEAADCCKLMAYVIVKALHNPDVPKPGEKGFAKKVLDGLDIEKELLPKIRTKTAKCLCLSQVEKDPPTNMYCTGPADRNWNWKAPAYRYSPTRTLLNGGYIGSYAMDAVAMALHCVYTTNSVGEAVMKAANIGGDADSVAAVTGQMAGAIYGVSGIKPLWCNYIMQWDNHGEIPLRAICCIFPEIRNEVIDPDALVK